MPSTFTTPPTSVKLGAMRLHILHYMSKGLSWLTSEVTSKNFQFPFMGSLPRPPPNTFLIRHPPSGAIKYTLPHGSPSWGSQIPGPGTKQPGTASMLWSCVIIQINQSPGSLQKLETKATQTAGPHLLSRTLARCYPVPRCNCLFALAGSILSCGVTSNKEFCLSMSVLCLPIQRIFKSDTFLHVLLRLQTLTHPVFPSCDTLPPACILKCE